MYNNSIHYTPQSTITVTLKRPPMPKWGMRGANHGEGEWGLQGTREPSEAVEAPEKRSDSAMRRCPDLRDFGETPADAEMGYGKHEGKTEKTVNEVVSP